MARRKDRFAHIEPPGHMLRLFDFDNQVSGMGLDHDERCEAFQYRLQYKRDKCKEPRQVTLKSGNRIEFNYIEDYEPDIKLV